MNFQYLLIFIGCIIEGPILMVASGFLLRLGILEFWPLFAAIVLGDLLGDLIWYYAGYFFLDPILERHGRWFSITPELVAKTKNFFVRYRDAFLIISKATLGFGLILAVLLVAGASKIPLRRYLAMNFIGELGIVSVLLSLGYFFGEMYHQIAQGFRAVFLISAAAVSVGLIYGFSRYMKKRIQNL